MEARKALRSNSKQIAYLINYMSTNQDFAAGEYRSPLGAKKYEEQWYQLKTALDELGPKRTVGQWKICWRDQKRKARLEGGEHSRAVNATGNTIPVPDLSENSALVLCAIGPEMAVGMGPAESEIGMPTEAHRASPAGPRPPSPAAPRNRQQRRVRRAVPSQSFLNAQFELNELMRELLTEVRRSNELREEHLAHIRSSSQQY